MEILRSIGDGLWNAFQMAWEVGWALVLGFLLSGIVQAWVPKSRMQSALGGSGPRQIALATGLGAASSSCSYAAIAIAKSMFAKGASFASAMTKPAVISFQSISTSPRKLCATSDQARTDVTRSRTESPSDSALACSWPA